MRAGRCSSRSTVRPQNFCRLITDLSVESLRPICLENASQAGVKSGSGYFPRPSLRRSLPPTIDEQAVPKRRRQGDFIALSKSIRSRPSRCCSGAWRISKGDTEMAYPRGATLAKLASALLTSAATAALAPAALAADQLLSGAVTSAAG